MYKIRKNTKAIQDTNSIYIDIETEGLQEFPKAQGTSSLKQKVDNLKISLKEMKKVNEDLINFIKEHHEDFDFEKYTKKSSI